MGFDIGLETKGANVTLGEHTTAETAEPLEHAHSRILDSAAQAYAWAAAACTGGTFEALAEFDDADQFTITLVPETAHWRLLEPDSAEGARLITALAEAGVESWSQVRGPHKRDNGIWEWTWRHRGVAIRAVCVGDPAQRNLWIRDCLEVAAPRWHHESSCGTSSANGGDSCGIS